MMGKKPLFFVDSKGKTVWKKSKLAKKHEKLLAEISKAIKEIRKKSFKELKEELFEKGPI